MSLRVFHEAGAWAPEQRIRLGAEESRYLLRVRRARVGASLELLDGVEAAWAAELVAAEGRDAVVRLIAPRPAVEVIPLELVLVVPEPKATLDALVGASELAATTIHLVTGEHSPGGLPSSERVARTLRASQRQCGRPRPPSVHHGRSLEQALAQTAERPGFVASVPQRHRPPTALEIDPARGARLLVGPEGGLSAAEAELAAKAGLRSLALGPWVLRTPTAVVAGLARLSAASQGPGSGGDGPPE